MRITAISPQKKDNNRINIMVDGSYRFSLDVFQYADLGIRVGQDYTDQELIELETESLFGKLYARALDYCLMRLHSAREVRDYLYRKTRDTRTKTGEVKKGVSVALTNRVFDRLLEKGYIDDEKFARHWVENRNLLKGVSQRKLQAELQAKGIDRVIIDSLLADSERTDDEELIKIVNKKRNRYPDTQKFMNYLARQGFSYETIKTALSKIDDEVD